MSIKDKMKDKLKIVAKKLGDTNGKVTEKIKEAALKQATSHLIGWENGLLILRPFLVQQAFTRVLKILKSEKIHSGTCTIMEDRLRIHLEMKNGYSISKDIIPTSLSVQNDVVIFKADLPEAIDIHHRNAVWELLIRLFAQLFGIEKWSIEKLKNVEIDGEHFTYSHSIRDSKFLTALSNSGLMVGEIPLTVTGEGLKLDLRTSINSEKEFDYMALLPLLLKSDIYSSLLEKFTSKNV